MTSISVVQRQRSRLQLWAVCHLSALTPIPSLELNSLATYVTGYGVSDLIIN